MRLSNRTWISTPLLGLVTMVLTAGLPARGVTWEQVPIDANAPSHPHCKAVGDLSGDGFPDIVIGGAINGGLVWYSYPSWSKHRIAEGSFTTDMQVGDIDGDGDLDVIVPNAHGLFWYRNPLPDSSPAAGPWSAVLIGAGGASAHDLEVGDLNGDGRLDVVTRNKNSGATTFWRQVTPDSWAARQISAEPGEGTALGDIDGDGDLDILHNGFWLETPFDTVNGTWTKWVVVANWPREASAHIVDVNGDGRVDLLLSPSETMGRFSWFETANPKSGPWVEHAIDAAVTYYHGFKSADVDRDGDLDLITAEMEQSTDPDEVVAYFNEGEALTWKKVVISTVGSHNVRVADIGRDGTIDIVGANHGNLTGESKVYLWRATNVALPLNRWTRRVIDPARPGGAAAFIAPADLNRDGLPDIVTGAWWYKNPGSAAGAWQRLPAGENMTDFALAHDLDGDGDLDLFGAGGGSNLAWSQNDGQGNFSAAVSLGQAPGDFLQGAVAARFQTGGPTEVALSWHNGAGGVQLLAAPPQPANLRTISTVSQDEQLSAGDIDRDGDLDLLLGTKWLRNDQGGWTLFTLDNASDPPDRNRLADIDGDGRLDAVIGFEAISQPGKLAWYQQPANPAGPWVEHVIGTVVGPMSLDVTDMDGDGDLDCVVGEHNLSNPSLASLYIFENVDGAGKTWTRHLVWTGDEHHDGAQVVDIDNDGDLDIISIGWGHSRVLLYENNALDPVSASAVRPSISPNGGTYLNFVTVTLSTATPGAEIRYTIDGSAPVATSLLYQAPFVLTSSGTVQARAFKAGLADSPPASAEFHIVDQLAPLSSGLKLWLRADLGVELSGAQVARWLDQSGNGAHASQPSASSRPLLASTAAGGKPALRFDGVDDFLTFTLPVNGRTGLTLFLVAANTANRTGGGSRAEHAALFWNETAAWGTVYLSPFQDHVQFRFGTTQTGNLPGWTRPSPIGSRFSLSVAVKDGARDRLYVDGALVVDQSGKLASIAACQDLGNLGRGYNNNTFFPGDIAEVLVYDRALSDAERRLVEDYLTGRYLISEPTPAPSTPLAVTVQSPAAGAVLQGTVPVTAQVTGGDASIAVQFFLNGAPLGAEDDAPPYSTTWDTTTVADGAHSLSARARAGNGADAKSPPVQVTVSNQAAPVSPPAPAPEPEPSRFRDDFSGPDLAAGWQFIDPRLDSTLSLSDIPGRARIAVPAGASHDCWSGVSDCARLLRPAAPAATVFETKIDGDPISLATQTYGLMLVQDSSTYMRFEFWTAGGQARPSANIVINGVGSNPIFGSPVTLQASNYLRVTRSGNQFELSYSFDGQKWLSAGRFTQSISISQAGLVVINAGSRPPTAANFDYFEMSSAPGTAVTPDPPPPVPPAPDPPPAHLNPPDLPPPPAVNAAFRDDFNTSSLDPTWQFQDPAGNSRWSLTSHQGHLRISLPAGGSHDCWGSTPNCAKLLRAVPASSAVFETKIDGLQFTQMFQACGILLWQDQRNYIRFEFWTNGAGVRVAAFPVTNGAGSTAIFTSPVALAPSNYLRVTRTGNSFKLEHSSDGAGWITAGTFTLALTVNRAGVEVTNAGANPATTADFDYFELR